MRRIFISVVIAIVLVSISIGFFTYPPANFPQATIYKIEKGTGLNALGSDLENKEIIRLPFWFKVFAVLFGGPKGIDAGDYALNKPENAIKLAYRFVRGDHQLVPVKVTIPEGLNNLEIAKIIDQSLKNFDIQKFITMASSTEGYLFPDTYFFLPNVTESDIIKIMKDNFTAKVGTVSEEVVKMASILELEARTEESRKIIAGILWERIHIGMPLQVDASFKYINGKTTATLSLADLKMNSPYNSYTNKGLPPTPISNPGLMSIQAALNPIKTPYLYFLTDKNGNMHYAKTFAEHLQNKEKYLQ